MGLVHGEKGLLAHSCHFLAIWLGMSIFGGEIAVTGHPQSFCCCFLRAWTHSATILAGFKFDSEGKQLDQR